MNIKEYKNYVLRLEYDKYVNIIDKLRRHIHLSDKNNNISTNDKNVYLNELFEILKKLNVLYNNCITYPELSDEIDSNLKLLLDQKKYDILHKQISRLRIIPIYKSNYIASTQIHEPLIEIKPILKLLINNIGMNNINSIVKLYTNNNYDKDTNRLIDFYDRIFFPLGISEIKVTVKEKIPENFELFNENIFIKKILHPKMI
jgi:hypothetical protein